MAVGKRLEAEKVGTLLSEIEILKRNIAFEDKKLKEASESIGKTLNSFLSLKELIQHKFINKD